MQLKGSIPRKSASLLLLRPSPPSRISFFDYDILVLQRHKHMSFGSALVFPGGKLEPETDQAHYLKYSLKGHLHSAALRETFEETGLFFPRQPLLQSQKLKQLEQIRLDYIANTFQQASKAKVKSYEQLSQLLAPSQSLIPFVRMITVPAIKRRYDATFFVLALQDYKYINFAKYAEHEKHLHNIGDILHCPHEYTNFRWMNPAEILKEHFSKTAVVAPPQFIMLNIMFSFTKRQQFMDFLKSHNSTENQYNPNLGPNVISLVKNTGSSAEKYPYAATLVGDREFPYDKIMATETCEQLKKEVNEWKEVLRHKNDTILNRFLFQQGKLFFQNEYEVDCRDGESVIQKMKGWWELRQQLDQLTI